MHSEDKMFQPGNDNELLQHVLLFKSFMFFQWPLVFLTERERVMLIGLVSIRDTAALTESREFRWFLKTCNHLDFYPSTCSPSLHPALRVSAFHHRPTRLHPLRGHVWWPTAGHHVAEGRAADPRQLGRNCGQHRLYQLAEDLQPNTRPQRQLHLHRPQWSCCCGAPEPADR